MRGYHLLSAKNAIDDLEHRRLKVARLADLNDPFELAALNCMKKDRRRALERFKRDQNERIGMLSFCEHWQDPVMWSHYADHHRGVCFGFDVDSTLGVGGLYEVQYVPGKLDLAHDLVITDRLPPDIERALLVTKFENWKYEREHRCFLHLSTLIRDGLHFFAAFSPQLRLREVILGPHCPRKSLARFRTLAKAIDSGILVQRARHGFKFFEVKPDGRYPPT